MSESRKPIAYVIQRPQFIDNWDMAAIEDLGEIEFLMSRGIDPLDEHSTAKEVEYMRSKIDESLDGDVFIAVGGSPFSNMAFGMAFQASDRPFINVGVYSRHQDADGRRSGRGKYHIAKINPA